MTLENVTRRDFNQLALAAFGGALAGLAAGCSPKGDSKKGGEGTEAHLCRGLNACKGKGKGGGNACAGEGGCATVASHACQGSNDCKGQGGCGEKPGQNECKGQGACSVPLKDSTWAKARKKFEDDMAKAGKKAGPAPAKT